MGANAELSQTPVWGKPFFLVLGALTLLTAIAMSPVMTCGFCNLDDDRYVTDNSDVRQGFSGHSVAQAFSHRVMKLYHPLSIVSLTIDYDLFGDQPAGYHVENLLFHICSSAILLTWLNWMTASLWRSAFVAGVFAIHPLRVESVAWVAERKDVLAVFFGTITLVGYTWYARRPSFGRYLPVFVCHILSLLAKPALVCLPFVLWLLDWWPTDRVRRADGEPASPRFAARSAGWLAVEKSPLVIVSFLSVSMTLPLVRRHFEQFLPDNFKDSSVVSIHGAPIEPRIVAPPDEFGALPHRLTTGSISYLRYLWKMVAITRLSAWYPESLWPYWMGITAGAAIVAITIFTFLYKKRWLVVGWLWYLATLLPLVGFVRIAHYSLADRYTYFPMIGILIAIGWSIPELWWIRRKNALMAAFAGLMLVLGGFTFAQTLVWRNNFTLWKHAIAVTSGNSRAHYQLGDAYLASHQFTNAVPRLEEAARLDPYVATYQVNLAAAYANSHQRDKAIATYRRVLDLTPNASDALNNLGVLLAEKGDTQGAADCHAQVLKLDPDNMDARINLGWDLLELKQPDKARVEFEKVLATQPQNADAHAKLARIYLDAGDLKKAIDHATQAVQIAPDMVDGYANLGRALLRSGDIQQAFGVLKTAARMAPDDADVKRDLEEASRKAGR